MDELKLKFVEYINWPALPSDLHDDILSTVVTEQDIHPVVANVVPTYNSTMSCGFRSYDASQKVTQWVYDTIPIVSHFNKNAQPIRLHVLENDELYPYYHRDKRPWAINYLVQTGGPNVTTDFFDHPVYKQNIDNSTIQLYIPEAETIHSEVIDVHRWHMLPYISKYPHAALNIEKNNLRVMISLGLYWYMDFKTKNTNAFEIPSTQEVYQKILESLAESA